MENNLNKGIEEIKEIKMTSEEKERVLQNILSSSPKLPVKSPYLVRSFISIFHRRSLVYSLSAFCLVVILGSGTVFASAGSLPGNILYPLKVKVVEPTTGAFVFSPIAKVEYQNNLAAKRLMEAEILAQDGKLDTAKEEELNSLLEAHTTAFHKAVIDLRQSENFDQDKDDDIITSFEATMNAHARILDIMTGQDIAGEETDTKISKTAKNNAKKTRENFRNKISKSKPAQAENEPVEATEATDENREQNEYKYEDEDSEREKLLDLKSSAKEADIFLKTGLELNIKSGI